MCNQIPGLPWSGMPSLPVHVSSRDIALTYIAVMSCGLRRCDKCHEQSGSFSLVSVGSGLSCLCGFPFSLPTRMLVSEHTNAALHIGHVPTTIGLVGVSCLVGMASDHNKPLCSTVMSLPFVKEAVIWMPLVAAWEARYHAP